MDEAVPRCPVFISCRSRWMYKFLYCASSGKVEHSCYFMPLPSVDLIRHHVLTALASKMIHKAVRQYLTSCKVQVIAGCGYSVLLNCMWSVVMLKVLEERFIVNFQGSEYHTQDVCSSWLLHSWLGSHLWTRNQLKSDVCLNADLFNTDDFVMTMEGVLVTEK